MDGRAAPATERLWLTDPRRKTCLARVVGFRGDAVALDRSLFTPASHAYRHPQPADQGTAWWEGEKRWVDRVWEWDGTLWHRLRGVVPPMGSELNLHLDPDRRQLASRAHTALHLLLKALADAHAPPLAADPEVKGGGTARIELAGDLAPARLAQALARANQWVAQDKPIERSFLPRDAAARLLDAQAFDPPDPFPGPADVLQVARIDGVCAYPCDGTHVERTSQVGRIVVTSARPGRGGRFVVALRVT